MSHYQVNLVAVVAALLLIRATVQNSSDVKLRRVLVWLESYKV